MRGTAILLVLRILLAAFALVQYLVVAYFFGLGTETDAYIIAQSVPLLFAGMGEAVLSYTFLPVFIDYRDRGERKDAMVISNTVFFACALAFSVVALLTLWLAPFIVTGLAPGLSHTTLELAGRLLMIMSPLILVRFLCSMLTALLNSVREFLLPALTSALPPVVAMGLLLAKAKTMGIVSLPIGYLIGTLLQFLLLVGIVHKFGMGIGRTVALGHPGVRQIGRLFGPRLLDFSFNGVNLAVDRWFASLLGPGFVSALTFAQRIVRFPNAMIMGSLGRTLLPALSSQRSQGDEANMRILLSKSIRLLAFVTLPVTLFIIFFREEVIRLLLQRGAFDAQSTSITAYALLFYAFGVLAYAISPILKVTFFSIQDTLTPLKISAGLVLANGVLDYFLMKAFGHGGIALSTSIVFCIGVLILWLFLEKRLGSMGGREIGRSLVRVLLISILIGLVLRTLSSAVFVFDADPWRNLAKTLLPLTIGAAMFLGICSLLRVPELHEILAMVRRGGGRRGLELPR